MSESSSERRLGAVKRFDDEPGSANTPLGQPGARPEPEVAERTAPGHTPVPGTNQGKNEPIGETPETSAQSRTASTTSHDPQAPATGDAGAPSPATPGSPAAGSPGDSGGARSDDPVAVAAAGRASRVPGEQGEPPRPIGTDDAAAAATVHPGSPPGPHAGVPSPGDSQGVAVPGVEAAAGTSEQSGAVHGVKTTALAAPGKPDGEVDTRP